MEGASGVLPAWDREDLLREHVVHDASLVICRGRKTTLGGD